MKVVKSMMRGTRKEPPMSKELEPCPTETHQVTMPTDKALEYLGALKDYANTKLPDPGFAIALSMAIGTMGRAATEANEALTTGFDVVDTQTGEYPDLQWIAINEDWAKGLIYCDMEGFAIDEDGNLVLMDECGNFAYPPAGRFQVVRRPPEGSVG